MYPVCPDMARKVFIEGFASYFSAAALDALKLACDTDDKRLTQGSTTTPPPLMCVQDWPCEAACGAGFAGWQGEGLKTVGEVEQFFAVACFRADTTLGEPAACRHFLNWFDDFPRAEVLANLSAWCGEVIESRAADRTRQPILDPSFDPFASLASV